jgi:hypothetical protein
MPQDREARVRIGAGVDDRSLGFATKRLDSVDELTFAVVLNELELHSQFGRDGAHR